jgi:hypothetical protein
MDNAFATAGDPAAVAAVCGIDHDLVCTRPPRRGAQRRLDLRERARFGSILRVLCVQPSPRGVQPDVLSAAI